MSADMLTKAQAEAIGKAARDYGNPLIGCFAAELVGDSYPFSESETEVMLRDFTDEELGRRIARWIDARN